MSISKPATREDQDPSSSEPITNAATPQARRQPDKFNRFKWRDDVQADHDPKVTANIKLLASGIAKFVNGETGEARVSTITLAEVCGCSEKWVRNMIPLLHNTGWAAVEFGSKGRGESHCNVYRINPEKRTPCTVLAKPEKRTVKPYFSALKSDPVSEEPLNHKKDSTVYVERSETPLDSYTDRLPVGIDSERDHKNGSSAAGKAAAVHCGESTAIRIEAKPTNSAAAGKYMCSAVGNGNGVSRADIVNGAAAATTGFWTNPVAEGSTMSASQTRLHRPNNVKLALHPPHQIGGRIPPINPEEITMRRRIETPREQFAKLVNVYPKDKRGTDDENALAAFELARDVGNDLNDLMYGAIKIAMAASQGADVPELVEFLLSAYWTDTRIAA